MPFIYVFVKCTKENIQFFDLALHNPAQIIVNADNYAYEIDLDGPVGYLSESSLVGSLKENEVNQLIISRN